MLRIFFIVWQVLDGCQFCLIGFFSLFISTWKCWSAFEWNFHLQFLALLISGNFFLSLFSLSLSIDSLHSCCSLMDDAQDVWGSILWSQSSSWLCGGSAGRTQVPLQDELCSCPAQVLGFGRWCCALNAMGTTLSVQLSHVQDLSEAHAENSWCLINAWEARLPALVRCNWFGHLLWIPHLS